tara:strand:- start:2344 stop:3594 length:1251 start_codon:yes stop_codon:yes gene_type:complete
MKIAVIGSGISGLSASYFLSKKNRVDLYEKEDRFGGHSYTLNIEYDIKNRKKIDIDIGFIVFNEITYPNLINFFRELNVNYEKSDMSFSVSVDNSNIEYCGRGLRGIFSNKKNLFNIRFLKMFYEIIKFYKNCEKLDIKNYKNITLGEFFEKKKLSNYFINYHIIPMASAIWSMPPNKVKQMPLKFFVIFFKNHGLFKIKDRPQWYTVTNRSKDYVKKVLNKLSGEHFKNYNINKIVRNKNNVSVYYGDSSEFFSYDKVILATHADEALNLIKNPMENEFNVLKNFRYKENIALVHSDERAMPKNKKNWSSWNAKVDNKNLQKSSVTYWINLLQNLKINKNIFLTINPYYKIPEEKIYKRVTFTHPYYDENTFKNQNNLRSLQNKDNILFCGSYFGYGFHEDGIKSSLEMIKFLND